MTAFAGDIVHYKVAPRTLLRVKHASRGCRVARWDYRDAAVTRMVYALNWDTSTESWRASIRLTGTQKGTKCLGMILPHHTCWVCAICSRVRLTRVYYLLINQQTFTKLRGTREGEIVPLLLLHLPKPPAPLESIFHREAVLWKLV